jgi:uncharacterized integral membrane protein
MHSPPSSPPEPARRRRKGSRRNSTLARARRLWRDWWVEIVVALLILLAIFLLVEQMNIRETLYTWLVAVVDGLGDLAVAVGGGLARFVRNTTLSDLLAYVLIVLVIALAAWRTRYRILTNPRLAEIRCPRCGGEVHRIHRRWYHRALSLILPLRRYGCKDRACGWQGLRTKKTH